MITWCLPTINLYDPLISFTITFNCKAFLERVLMALPNRHIKEYISKWCYKNCAHGVKLLYPCTIKRRTVIGKTFKVIFG